MYISNMDEEKHKETIFDIIGRPVYFEINLDSLTHNINILRRNCGINTAIIGVVKAGAYGHGSIVIAKHLKANGVERLAVATVDEAIHLRSFDVEGPLHVLGNVSRWEMESCLKYHLIPTVGTEGAVRDMANALQHGGHSSANSGRNTEGKLPRGSINIEVDSGMSRYGCQPSELKSLMDTCGELGVCVDGLFTHFADSWGDQEFTQYQLETFLSAITPFKTMNMKIHTANSGAILRHFGTDLDFVRPGISMYGVPPGNSDSDFEKMGFKPIGSIIGIPSLVKKLSKGRYVGYGKTYEVEDDEEWIATFQLGYADGYWSHLSKVKGEGFGFAVRNKTGEKCPIVGRVSMDAMTVRLSSKPDENETFTFISADFDPDTSIVGIARRLGIPKFDILTSQSNRLPKVYVSNNGKPSIIINPLKPECY